MQVSVVPIGNSKGIRIPKKLLYHCGIGDKLELNVEEDRIVLEPVRKNPRAGWAEAAQKMHERGDDKLLIPDVFADEEFLEW